MAVVLYFFNYNFFTMYLFPFFQNAFRGPVDGVSVSMSECIYFLLVCTILYYLLFFHDLFLYYFFHNDWGGVEGLVGSVSRAVDWSQLFFVFIIYYFLQLFVLLFFLNNFLKILLL